MTSLAHAVLSVTTVLLAALLTGCAGFRPAVYAYPKLGITLVCADEDSIDRNCRTPNMKTDKGAPYPTNYTWKDKEGFTHADPILVPACFKIMEREIWMKWGDWCDTMAHELCHADGQPKEFCEDNYPRR